jgi:hypothetical protein
MNLSYYESRARSGWVICNTKLKFWFFKFPKHQKSFLLCFIYRPPNGNVSWYPYFDKELTNAFAKNDYVLITGDINIDYLKPLPKYTIYPPPFLFVLSFLLYIKLSKSNSREFILHFSSFNLILKWFFWLHLLYFC